MSTGIGPVGYYTSIGAPRRSTVRSRAAGPQIGTATAQRQLAAAQRAADKQNQAAALAAALDGIMNIHRGEFSPAQRPIAPPPAAVDPSPYRDRHIAEAKAATSPLDRSARKAALVEAERRTAIDVNVVAAQWNQQRAQYQCQLDRWWAAMLANDVGTVLHALTEAFEDNEAAAAAVGLDGSELTLVVVVPPMSAIPEREPAVTQAGNLSLKKLTKGDRAGYYTSMVCGHILITLKEAFAVAPGVMSARIVAVRASQRDAYGQVAPEALVAARFERSAFDGVRWAEAGPAKIVLDTSSELLMNLRGATQEMMPLDLSAEPELVSALSAIDVDVMS